MEAMSVGMGSNTRRAGEELRAMRVQDAAKTDTPMTEIEACTAQLADSARRLTTLADRLQSRVDGFMQTCEATNPAPPNIEPQPGTLGALKYFQGRIDSQCDRLHAHLNTLAGIL